MPVDYLGYAIARNRQNPIREGFDSLGNVLDTLRTNRRLDTQEMRQSRLSDLQAQNMEGDLQNEAAQRTALQNVYGGQGKSLADAYTAQMLAEQQAVKHKQFMESLKAIDSMPLDEQGKNEAGRKLVAQFPEYAEIAPNITFISKDKIELVQTVNDGEIPNPAKPGTSMPAGTYKLGGMLTSNPGQPVKWTTIMPYEPKKETWSEPFAMSVGGKKAMVQKSSSGQIRPVIQDVSTTVKVTAGGGGSMGQGLGGMSQEDIDHYGKMYNLTGTLPSLGMGASPLRTAILKSASRQARGEGKGAIDVVTDVSDVKAMRSSVQQQEKVIGAMGSFVKNIDKQVNRVENLSKNLASFDTRLLNMPLRAVRGRVVGSPNQAKYDMYLTEIESEIGKLATGSSASIAELSIGAQEKWAKIHDKNLSVKDMISLLKETKHAAQMRYDSAREEVADTRGRMRQIGKSAKPSGAQIAPAGTRARLKDGRTVVSDGKGGWK